MEKEDVVKEISNEDAEKLQQFKELARSSFRSLKPAQGYRKGYFIKNDFTIDSYLHLDDTIKCLLNVCILSLDGYSEINNRYHKINEMPRQVATVLKLARGLIPSEEFEYLDEIRELLLKEDESPSEKDS